MRKEVIEQIISAFESGREALDYLITLETDRMSYSFSMALEIVEMLSEVQNALEIFHDREWWGKATQFLQDLIGLFNLLADAYEMQDGENYDSVLSTIHLQYRTSQTFFINEITVS